ncbi:MAG: hypothetical protein HRU25_08020 [Psychrobium sp.]|nr:hypothetical protein [Psychrobium sp.]
MVDFFVLIPLGIVCFIGFIIRKNNNKKTDIDLDINSGTLKVSEDNNVLSINNALKNDLKDEIVDLAFSQVEFDENLINGSAVNSEQLRIQSSLRECIQRARQLGVAKSSK